MSETTDAAARSGAKKSSWPAILNIVPGDVIECLEKGIRDFRSAPKYGLFFGFVFAIGGWLVTALVMYFEMPFLAYPLATGFALIAPFVATGLYDVSRRLERGEPLSWSAVLGSVRATGGKELAWMAVVTVFTLIIWMDIAAFLFFAFMGFGGGNSGDLLNAILTTPAGWTFLFIGHVIGAILASLVFAYSAVSFPMLFDREVDFVTAMVTSVKVVAKNPKAMFTWAAIIGLFLILSLASMFAGLIVALPILGHTTWHVYRRTVGPAP